MYYGICYAYTLMDCNIKKYRRKRIIFAWEIYLTNGFEYWIAQAYNSMRQLSIIIMGPTPKMCNILGIGQGHHGYSI